MLVVWCPDWPVMAAGVPAATPAAVVHANRIVACTPAARADGVRPGLRRREAQGRCPDLELLDQDHDRDARMFESVAAALESLVPRVEVVRPGVLAVAARGASRYHGGDRSLVARVATAVDEALGPLGRCQVGLADGLFAAGLAARRATIVPPGGTPAFLRAVPVAALGSEQPAAGALPDLVDLFVRLGLRTLGDLADLPADAVGARFGPEGSRAHRLAKGKDERPVAPRHPPPDLAVAASLDPPAEQVATAAFTAKALAGKLRTRLDALGLVCTRVRIEAETEHGELLVRVWRSDVAGSGQADGFSAAAIAERVRWQLEGWLAGPASTRPTGGIALLRLVPDELAGAQGRQLGFWGGDRQADERAMRALARVQGLLGHDAVVMPVLRGGRGPGERVAHVPPLGAEAAGPGGPAGRIPSPRGMLAFARAVHPAGSAAPVRSGGPDTSGVSGGPGGPGALGVPGGPGEPDGPGALGVPGGPGEPGGPGALGVPGGPGEPGGPGASGVPAGPNTSRSGVQRSGASRSGGIGWRGSGPARRRGAGGGGPGWGSSATEAPWPGRVPAPAPATVHARLLTAELLDDEGAVVTVTRRGALGPDSGPPARLWVGGFGRGRVPAWATVAAWAGPWPAEERWWDRSGAAVRLDRFQVVTGDGRAYLLVLVDGQWWVEATYD
jgi:protein ImuB